MERIRPVALALPGVVERLSHGSPTFFTAEGPRGHTFASAHDEREWREGRLCLWAAGPRELQEALVSGGPERFFVPRTSIIAAGAACGSTSPKWTGTRWPA